MYNSTLWSRSRSTSPSFDGLLTGDAYRAVGRELLASRVVQKLAAELERLLVAPGHGEVNPAPFGVEFPDTEQGVQPDFIFVRRDRLQIIGEDWVRGAPDLVVEILSPATAARDRGVKLKPYRGQGVSEYWIVDPDARVVEVWDLAGEAAWPERYTDRLPVGVGGEAVGHITLATLFRPR